MKNKIILCLAITAIYASVGCNKESKSVEQRKQYTIPDSLLKTLHIEPVQEEQLINSFTLTGQVDFNQDNVVNVFPLISGNISGIKVVLGDYVQVGEVLGVMKSAEMAQYSSAVVNAETNLRLSELMLNKTKDMYKSGLASKSDSLNAEVSAQQAKAELSRAKIVLKINGNSTQQGEYLIKAPISGFIVQKYVTNNQIIRPDNGNALFTISDLKNVWVWANVYESNADNIHLGDNVNISTLSKPDRVFKGNVDKIMHILDPTSKAMKVRVTINNPDYLLKPQMFASVTITNADDKQAMCIPTKALIFDHSQYYVLVYHGNGKAAITPVQKLNTIGSKTYLSTGVKTGDKVIASDALQIYSELNN